MALLVKLCYSWKLLLLLLLEGVQVIQKALDHADSLMKCAIATIVEFCKCGAVSEGGANGKHAPQVLKLIDKVAEHLAELPGEPRVLIHQLPQCKAVNDRGVFPCVTAE